MLVPQAVGCFWADPPEFTGQSLLAEMNPPHTRNPIKGERVGRASVPPRPGKEAVCSEAHKCPSRED